MIKITNTTQKFKEMFNMIICGNRYPLFPDFNLNVGEEITITTTDPSNSAMTEQVYQGFEIIGNGIIPLDNSIMNVIKLFNNDEIIELLYDDDRLTISSSDEDSRNTIIVPANESKEKGVINADFGDRYISLNGTSHDFVGIVENVNCKYFSDQIKKASLNEYSANTIEINNGVVLSVGDISKFEISASTEIKIDTEGQITGSYMGAYTDVFKTLSGEVSIKITKESLLVISQKNEDYQVNYLLSPAAL